MKESASQWVTGHDVRFYATDAYLAETVAEYLADGIRAGQPVVIIATASHLGQFAQSLRSRGIDTRDLVEGRDIVLLDARDTLSAFMDGARPDRELFFATVGNVFQRLTANRRYVIARAYGEMVDLLWQEGRGEGAIALEALWNELAERYAFRLLCCYHEAALSSTGPGPAAADICAIHGHMLGAENPHRVQGIAGA